MTQMAAHCKETGEKKKRLLYNKDQSDIESTIESLLIERVPMQSNQVGQRSHTHKKRDHMRRRHVASMADRQTGNRFTLQGDFTFPALITQPHV